MTARILDESLMGLPFLLLDLLALRAISSIDELACVSQRQEERGRTLYTSSGSSDLDRPRRVTC
jgi:hypothetical protein